MPGILAFPKNAVHAGITAVSRVHAGIYARPVYFPRIIENRGRQPDFLADQDRGGTGVKWQIGAAGRAMLQRDITDPESLGWTGQKGGKRQDNSKGDRASRGERVKAKKAQFQWHYLCLYLLKSNTPPSFILAQKQPFFTVSQQLFCPTRRAEMPAPICL